MLGPGSKLGNAAWRPAGSKGTLRFLDLFFDFDMNIVELVFDGASLRSGPTRESFLEGPSCVSERPVRERTCLILAMLQLYTIGVIDGERELLQRVLELCTVANTALEGGGCRESTAKLSCKWLRGPKLTRVTVSSSSSSDDDGEWSRLILGKMYIPSPW